MKFEDNQRERYRRIIEFLSPPDGTVTSTAELEKELDWGREDIDGAVRDLIAFGELELINTSQHGRVRLRKSTPSTKEQATLADLTGYVWYSYITEQDGQGQTRARRLFSSREAAEEHLKQIAKVDALTSVPGVAKTWCALLGNGGYTPEYAVVRREPVFQQADDPYPESR